MVITPAQNLHFSFSMANEEFLVLDGGLGTELNRVGFDIFGDPLWSARILVENPEAVKSVHKSFLTSGANVLTTASYQASLQSLSQHCGFDNSEAFAVIQKSVKIAQEACNEIRRRKLGGLQQKTVIHFKVMKNQRRLLVAGSVGPYGACQHDMSEYTGKYVDKMSVQELMNWHRPRVKALIQAGADILAMETVPALKEAEALIQLLKEFPTAKAWLSLSCQDGSHTCHGELFRDVIKTVHQSTQIVALGVNCTSPLFVKSQKKTKESQSFENPVTVYPSLLQSIKGKVNVPLLVYPNADEVWKDLKQDCSKGVDISCYVEEWIEAGACWIGGCCYTQPKDIEKIREIVDRHR